ncbi:MAG: BspA family leucine-rich repeat surface protein [Lachnospiraceae bacterium]
MCKKILLILAVFVMIMQCACSNDSTIKGDGWYYSDGKLTITEIRYGISTILCNQFYNYDKQWLLSVPYDEITEIVVNGSMVYDENYSFDDGSEPSNDYIQNKGGLFSHLPALTSVKIKKLDLNGVQSLSNMFMYDTNLVNVNLSGLKTDNVIDMSNMFYNNSSIVTLDLNNWDTGKVTSVNSMFRDCTSLKSLSASNWNTDNIRDFSHMFDNCESMTEAIFTNWNIIDSDVVAMFGNCKSLSNVEINVNMSDSIVANYMFDENNSIGRYDFADDWELNDEAMMGIIADRAYKTFVHVAPSTSGDPSAIYKTIVYSKKYPDWYKHGVEIIEFLTEGAEKVYDIYCTAPNGAKFECILYKYCRNGEINGVIATSDVLKGLTELEFYLVSAVLHDPEYAPLELLKAAQEYVIEHELADGMTCDEYEAFAEFIVEYIRTYCIQN